MARINERRGGRRSGAGRKSKAEEFGLAALLDKCWTLQDREVVIAALHKKAKAGNDKAAALLLAYAYGKPTERHEHSFDLSGLTDDELKSLEPIVRKLTRS